VLDRLDGTGYVVRTAWLYGAHGPNFVRTMIRLEQQRPDLDVVDDQHGQPTWTMDVADRIVALVSSGAPAGVYHATSSGETTWFGLAREVFRLLGADPDRVRPVGSAAYARPATMPGAGPASARSGTGGWPCGRRFRRWPPPKEPRRHGYPVSPGKDNKTVTAAA
jgi:dTDP-4-dehydrorhamnose reductase